MLNTYDWDWDHAIFVNQTITEDFVASLTPQILRFKQRNPKVITVGIDSNGGSIAGAIQLLELLKAPGTTGEVATVVTVAVNKAYSAAATFLGLGDYAVALPSAQIHYHDLRFGTFHDLTSSKATEAARSLQRENDRLALKLANSVVERLTWIFIDLRATFEDAKKELPSMAVRVDELGLVGMGDMPNLDLAGLVCAQHRHTSAIGDDVIGVALERLKGWRTLELAFDQFSGANRPADDSAALFRDDNPMLAVVNGSLPADKRFTWSNRKGLQNDLVLLFLILFGKAARDPSLRMREETIADLMIEYAFFKEIRQKQHIDKALALMWENDYILFGDFVSQKLRDSATTKEERAKLMAVVYPQIQAYWAYVVLLCRTLFDGEHPISLDDALFLGLIDEVSGRNFPEPRRHIRARRIAKEHETAKRTAAPLRKWRRK